MCRTNKSSYATTPYKSMGTKRRKKKEERRKKKEEFRMGTYPTYQVFVQVSRGGALCYFFFIVCRDSGGVEEY